MGLMECRYNANVLRIGRSLDDGMNFFQLFRLLIGAKYVNSFMNSCLKAVYERILQNKQKKKKETIEVYTNIGRDNVDFTITNYYHYYNFRYLYD